jgi:hypothetical protein
MVAYLPSYLPLCLMGPCLYRPTARLDPRASLGSFASVCERFGVETRLFWSAALGLSRGWVLVRHAG